MNNIEMKKRRRVVAVLAFMLPFIPVTGATAFFMSCSNPTGGETEKPQDLVFTISGIIVTIDASVKNTYSQTEIDKFKGYLTDMPTWTDTSSVKLDTYINSKPGFKLIIKPLTGTQQYQVVNDKELVINSTIASTADDLLSWLFAGVNGMISFSDAGQLSKTI